MRLVDTGIYQRPRSRIAFEATMRSGTPWFGVRTSHWCIQGINVLDFSATTVELIDWTGRRRAARRESVVTLGKTGDVLARRDALTVACREWARKEVRHTAEA